MLLFSYGGIVCVVVLVFRSVVDLTALLFVVCLFVLLFVCFATVWAVVVCVCVFV